MATIRAYSRLHVSLIDLGRATARTYGGAGFSVSSPPIDVSVELSDETTVTALHPIDCQAITDAYDALARAAGHFHNAAFRVVVRSLPPQHVGLGTKSALLLSVIQAAAECVGVPLSMLDIQTLSGRGGTSGIGVNSFFCGGYLVDGGHITAGDATFRPSSAQRPARVPPVLTRLPIPHDWLFALILPDGTKLHGRNEVAFFEKATPIPVGEVLVTLSAIHHGVSCAVAEHDIAQLNAALEILHRNGFKSRELDNQTVSVRRLFEELQSLRTCATGLSGIGPLLYTVMHRDDNHAQMAVTAAAARYGARILDFAHGRNQGYELL